MTVRSKDYETGHVSTTRERDFERVVSSKFSDGVWEIDHSTPERMFTRHIVLRLKASWREETNT